MNVALDVGKITKMSKQSIQFGPSNDQIAGKGEVMPVAENTRPIRVLVVGTFPPPFGGATWMVKLLLDGLKERRDVQAEALNTGGSSGGLWRDIQRAIRSLYHAIILTRSTDVVTLHLIRPTIAPVFILIARVFRKAIILRIIGSTAFPAYGGPLTRYLARWGFRHADLTLFETKRMIATVRDCGVLRAKWYPNSRPMPKGVAGKTGMRLQCRRFVFLGRVMKEKGIDDILAIDGQFPEAVKIDIYGPLGSEFSAHHFANCQNIAYRGEIQTDLVPGLLENYDALLLPTRFSGEGYPGVILEAFASGIPVVATRWLGIPEVVDASCGILIEPSDTEGLVHAMRSLVADSALYGRLCKGAIAKQVEFSSAHWIEVFVDYCREAQIANR